MAIDIVHTQEAPEAIGPYSQAIVSGGFVFTSGQIGLKPEGEMAGDDVESQTRQVFANLRAVLGAAGTSLGKAVKINVFLADMNDFPKVNEIYASELGEHKPARATVQVARLPKDARIEIDVVAVK